MTGHLARLLRPSRTDAGHPINQILELPVTTARRAAPPNDNLFDRTTTPPPAPRRAHP